MNCEIKPVDNMFSANIYSVIEMKDKVRHKWLSPYSYNGKAAAGSSESDAVWKIVRIEIAGDGSVVEIKTLNNVKWSDRLILVF